MKHICPTCRLVFSEMVNGGCPRCLVYRSTRRFSDVVRQDEPIPDTDVQDESTEPTEQMSLTSVRAADTFCCIQCGKDLYCPECGTQQDLLEEAKRLAPRELKPHRGLELLLLIESCADNETLL